LDDVVEFPRARTKPLSEDEALERLRQAGRIEGVGTFAELVGWERTGASRVVGQWERDGKVVRTPRPGYPTVIEAVVAGVPAMHTPIAAPVLHTPAQPVHPVAWWWRVVRRRTQPVPHPAILAPMADRPAKRDRITILIALATAAVSAWFSIYGMTAIFVGAFLPVVALGVVLELGKLRAVALIGIGRGSWRLRVALIAMVGVLMTLNAVGAYGFLSKAHIAATEKAKAATEEAKNATEKAQTATAASLADIDGKIAEQNTNIANINRQLSEIHAVIDKATAQGKTNGAMALINQQRNNLAQLQTDLQAVGRVLTDLKVRKANIEPSPGKRDEEAKEVEADLGPIRDLAALVGGNDQDVLRRFTLVISLLLDPLAVLLLLAAAATRTT
jgi:hypothetical protein